MNSCILNPYHWASIMTINSSIYKHLFKFYSGLVTGIGLGYGALPASGAIASVLGAYILRFPRAEVVTLVPLGFFLTTIRLPAYFFLGFWFLQQAFFSFVSLQNTEIATGGVAYLAHAGGFLVGLLLAPLLGLFEE
jgi:membrane associated rhomboid family serine protease